MKKDQLCKIFKHKYNLTVLVEVNHTQVNFLDISLNLQTGIFKPYMKPNNHVMYVHADSNHPPAVKKNLPQNINNRLSRISANEEVFNEAAPTYQQALAASGYNHQLKFQPNIRSINRNKRNRNRKVIWFNPPWSSNVKSNVGALFLRILSECFPKGHVLHKAFNRNNVKVSYRTVDNVQKIVSRHNLRIINSQQPTPPPTTCRCHYPKSPLCPILCQAKNLVYRCRVTNPSNNNVSTYTGLTSQTLKKRWDKHMSDCRRGCGTTLASFVGELRDSGVNIDIFAHLEWAIKKHAKPFNPVSNQCFLCLYEKYFILWEPHDASLNRRTEIFSVCRHKECWLLVKN